MKRLAIIISIISAGVLSVALADTPAQLLRQAEEALNAYRFDRATSQFNAYQAALKKAKLPVDSAALSAARSIPRLRQVWPIWRSHCCTGVKPPLVVLPPAKQVGISLYP